MAREDFYRKWAIVYTNSTYLKKLDFVAMVEGKEDKLFWQKIFEYSYIQAQLLDGSDNPENRAAGKGVCLQYLPYLNNRFIICIDSDYDHLKQCRPDCCAQRFVLQTYTYSIENHYLASNSSIQCFLQEYSRIIYNAFLGHLAKNSSINDFCELIALKNARESLEKLANRLRERYPQSFDNPYTSSCLMENNTYLFIKAKQLKGVLNCPDCLTFSHFPIDKILADISTIHN